MYAKYIKRLLDVLFSLIMLVVLSPVLLILTVVGTIAMKGNPFFTQPRPGKDEKIFHLIKFRTMTNRKDQNETLLPDEQRLTAYGKFLRSTSLDELLELVNILLGDMSFVGPRPQLVRDMVFMTAEQRKRHAVRQGLTGLAQVNGRNNMSWEQKLAYDLQYIEHITFLNDAKIFFKTFCVVLKRENTVRDGTASDLDLGDWLLQNGRVHREEYEQKQNEADTLLKV